ncbi:hypothetical protein BGX27_009343 [Mortierella sp. AM989]|nr:hypothetical protein BGX27_009343 [Mortierella sp. AM989]
MIYTKLVSLAVLFCSALVVSGAPATAYKSGPTTKCSGWRMCKDVRPVNSTKDFLCGDPRLGPRELPRRLPLFDIVDPYDRLGGLCAFEFLKKWTTNPTNGSYHYPPKFGFQLNTSGEPIQGNMTLFPGALLDRFGSEYGSYMSPAEAPYPQRALPPSNLYAPPGDNQFPYNYHLYKVVKEFVVLAGPIAPYFGQPGQGVQYYTYRRIMELIDDGILVRVL